MEYPPSTEVHPAQLCLIGETAHSCVTHELALYSFRERRTRRGRGARAPARQTDLHPPAPATRLAHRGGARRGPFAPRPRPPPRRTHARPGRAAARPPAAPAAPAADAAGGAARARVVGAGAARPAASRP